jgi:archaellum component FlaG (FlaF/FlaG flagellin family)
MPVNSAMVYGSLKLFLIDPAVLVDTNHFERALRAIPMATARKNRLPPGQVTGPVVTVAPEGYHPINISFPPNGNAR